jgi:hypothetical protein
MNPVRNRLHNRRSSENFSFECNGLKYTATVSRYTNGNVSEVFISNNKPSSQSDVNARDAGIAASLALQFGCPLQTLRHALLRDAHGKASSPLGVALDLVGEQS